MARPSVMALRLLLLPLVVLMVASAPGAAAKADLFINKGPPTVGLCNNVVQTDPDTEFAVWNSMTPPFESATVYARFDAKCPPKQWVADGFCYINCLRAADWQRINIIQSVRPWSPYSATPNSVTCYFTLTERLEDNCFLRARTFCCADGEATGGKGIVLGAAAAAGGGANNAAAATTKAGVPGSKAPAMGVVPR